MNAGPGEERAARFYVGAEGQSELVVEDGGDPKDNTARRTASGMQQTNDTEGAWETTSTSVKSFPHALTA